MSAADDYLELAVQRKSGVIKITTGEARRALVEIDGLRSDVSVLLAKFGRLQQRLRQSDWIVCAEALRILDWGTEALCPDCNADGGPSDPCPTCGNAGVVRTPGGSA